MDNITLQEKRTKLLPMLFLCLFGWACFGVVLLAHPITFCVQSGGEFSNVLGALLLFVVLAAFTICSVLRVIRPTRLDISIQQLMVTSFDKTRTYAWSDLGEPCRAVVKAANSYSIASMIAIPRLDTYDPKPLIIRGDDYLQSFEAVLDGLVQASQGKLVQQPHIQITKPYWRSIALNLAISVVGIVAILLIYVPR